MLVTILGGNHGRPHSGDASDPQAKVAVETTLDFLDHYLLDGAASVARLEADATVAGDSRYLWQT